MKTEPKLGSAELIELVDRHSAHNYHPLPVVVAEAEDPGSPTSRAGATSTCWPPTPR